MALTTPTVRPAVWAESGDTTAASTGEQQSGYIVGKPSRRKTNWLLNWIDNAVQYLLRRGIPAWSASRDYVVGDIVEDDSVTIAESTWRCTAARSATATKPDADSAHWERFGHSDGEVNQMIANALTGNDPSPVSASNSAVLAEVYKTVRGPDESGSYRELWFKVTFGTGLTSTHITVNDSNFHIRNIQVSSPSGPSAVYASNPSGANSNEFDLQGTADSVAYVYVMARAS